LRNKNLQNLGIGLLNLNKKVQIFEYLLSNVSNVEKKKNNNNKYNTLGIHFKHGTNTIRENKIMKTKKQKAHCLSFVGLLFASSTLLKQ